MRLIDGDALKLEFMENGDGHTGYEIHRVIDKAPTVDAALVVRGEWKWQDKSVFIMRYFNTHDSYRCNRCGVSLPYKTNFCPNCGADMREES